MQDRSLQLAFNREIQEKTKIEIEISQNSSISPVLFLIYIRDMFSDIEDLEIRYPSYMDDICLTTASESIERNCSILEEAAEKLIQSQNFNMIQFDMEKTELIHFHSKRNINSEDYPILVQNESVQPKNLVRWLGIWLDPKLSFKEHVEKKIADTTRIFHQIARLSNTEKGLSFQAIRQLYIACITSVADYGVPIWWNNQKFLLDKFQKLQNMALRKILGAFKTSPAIAMKLEAALPPPKVRFNRTCKNFALRILQMPKNHILRTRVSSSFLLYSLGTELDWSKYLDWNEKEQQEVSISKKKKSKIVVSQLFKITAMISDLLPSLKTEKIKQKWNAPWAQNLDLLMFIKISELDKEKEAVAHQNKIQKIISNNRDNSNMILYSDGSKNEQLDRLGAGVFYTTNFAKNQSQSFS